jgi:sugar/nucleoside kinase (ribokinase family)
VHFVAVGDVMVDVVCSQLPPPDTRVHADVSIRAGGSAVNAAAAAAGAGASAAVVGRTGSDQAAEFVTAELERRGIQAHLARDHELPTGVAVSLGATPSVVANRGANARLSAEDIPDPLEADALLVSGFALFQGGSAEAARTALDRFSGPWAGIDLSSPRLAAAARDVDFGDVGRRRTVVLATPDEARAMTGKEPEEAARSLASRFAVACIKLGEQGALAAAGEGVERGAVDPLTRRSPFGAGDAFAATLLIALATETPLGRALDLACAAGARAAAAQGRA